jgi:chromosome segregation protein
LGFKSFCESTDFLIQPGLTGVVGPNGCGKSNLVEALRWVMGENSYKNMRASGMDDVIFSGGGSRAARNFAEVGLVLDNSARLAPAGFNDADLIEVTRRIEREQGSTYRINGKEVRARDVQLLFADAATGARSPSLVRQGQIGEIISAKPQARRRILEDAAGVAGLHSRRHEAELRLNAASENLTRLEDVLKQVESQGDSLRRQARQAARYREVAAKIRQNEALVALVSYQIAADQLRDAARKLEADILNVQTRTLEQAEAAKLQAIAAHELPKLREKEAEAGAAVHRLVAARQALEADEQRAKQRISELARQIEQFMRDLERERALIEDAAEVAQRLEDERADLLGADLQDDDREAEARERLAEIEAKLAETELALSDVQQQLAGVNARRGAIESALRDENARVARFQAELTRLDTEFALIAGQGGGVEEAARLAEAFEMAVEEARAADEAAQMTEEGSREAREAEAAARQPVEQAALRAQRLETEVRTLENLLQSGAGGLWAPVVESVTVEKGYETALGAALGDDLDASAETSAPAHWALTADAGDPSLPPGVRPLLDMVEAPPALRRRLAQIGVVLRTEGESLRKLLRPGQRLVSREGDLWRWDGFTQAAEAPTPAARRLAEKNRLADLRAEAARARAEADALAEELDAAREATRLAALGDAAARDAQRRARARLEEARITGVKKAKKKLVKI